MTLNEDDDSKISHVLLSCITCDNNITGVKCPTDSRNRPDQRLLEEGQVWPCANHVTYWFCDFVGRRSW